MTTDNSKIFLTSDLHFYHKNIQKYSPKYRPWNGDVHYMNEELIRIWNESLSYEDTMIFLGDFSFGTTLESARIIDRLQFGKLIFVRGNHDTSEFCNYMKYSSNRDIQIKEYYETRFEKDKVVMFHFPIEDWNGKYHKSMSVHLHGHSHGHSHKTQNRLDVGWDAHGKILSIEEAVRLAKK